MTSGLDINSMHALTKPGKQLMPNGAGLFGYKLWTERMSVVGSVEQYFGSHADSREVCDVNLHLVHADATDDGCALAFRQHVTVAGESPGEAIVIAEGNDSDFGFARCGEGAAVAKGIAGRELLHASDAAGDADGQFQFHGLLHGRRRIETVKAKADAHHVVMRLGKADRTGCGRSMNLKLLKAGIAQLFDHVIKGGDLLSREIVRAGIVGGGKVGAESGKPHDFAGTNFLGEVEGCAWINAEAVHSGIDFQMDIEDAAAC